MNLQYKFSSKDDTLTCDDRSFFGPLFFFRLLISFGLFTGRAILAHLLVAVFDFGTRGLFPAFFDVGARSYGYGG